MSHVSPWFYVLLALIVIAVVAWPATLLVRSNRKPPAGVGDVPKDRWSTGGMFRGDPRAVSRRDEMPDPADLPSPSELGPDDGFPSEPGEMEHRRRPAGGTGSPGETGERPGT